MTGFNALIKISEDVIFDEPENVSESINQTVDNPKSKLDYALEAAQYGYKVFPVHYIEKGVCSCGKNDCDSQGKHPMHTGWKDEATTDQTSIKRIWAANPNANIGIKTGADTGKIAVDIDPKHCGDENYRELEEEYGKLPDTVESKTGSGGCHKIFNHPGGYIGNKQGFIKPGIDIRGDGGFIVAPGSDHMSGNRYEWDVMCHPEDVPIADLPQWFIEKLKTPSSSGSHTPASEQAKKQLEELCGKCEFIRWCKEHQEDVSETLWYSLISNISRISPVGLLCATIFHVNTQNTKVRKLITKSCRVLTVQIHILANISIPAALLALADVR